MDIILNDAEARALVCLIEKSLTTPDYYPLTLNSLTAACNQKSNRIPVMTLDESAVTDALDGLRYTHHLVGQVSVAGSRVPKFRHDTAGKLPLLDLDLALMCELLVRGPQTAGELRTHGRRLCEIESVATVAEALNTLATLEPTPVVVRIPPSPGHREPRYAHLLCGDVEVEEDEELPTRTHRTPSAGRDAHVASLEEKVEALQGEIQELRAMFETFRKQFE
jgi:uncharacterized protein YceH (UPF0502 family)